MPNFNGITPWHSPTGAVPEYPRASNDPGTLPARGRDRAPAPPSQRGYPPVRGTAADPSLDVLRAELRALVAEELAQLIKR